MNRQTLEAIRVAMPEYVITPIVVRGTTQYLITRGNAPLGRVGSIPELYVWMANYSDFPDRFTNDYQLR